MYNIVAHFHMQNSMHGWLHPH